MFRHSCNFPYYFDDSDYENNGYGAADAIAAVPVLLNPTTAVVPVP